MSNLFAQLAAFIVVAVAAILVTASSGWNSPGGLILWLCTALVFLNLLRAILYLRR